MAGLGGAKDHAFGALKRRQFRMGREVEFFDVRLTIITCV
jgi:hypothetical protein